MPLPSPAVIGYSYGLSELLLSLLRRSKGGGHPLDRGSLRLLWAVIILSVVAANFVVATVPSFHLPRPAYPLAVGLFAAGLVLRWYAIIYLGRFFTVNVAIQKDHHVIDSGPYRFVRHPSYTGGLLAFVGYGLCLLNGLALVVLLVPVTAAYWHRIRIEEAALTQFLREPYAAYCRRTKRLIPFVYQRGVPH